MALVKTTTKDNATINIHDDYLPKDKGQYKRNLIIFYDNMNVIARDLEANGIDTMSLFYTKEELEKLPKEYFI